MESNYYAKREVLRTIKPIDMLAIFILALCSLAMSVRQIYKGQHESGGGTFTLAIVVISGCYLHPMLGLLLAVVTTVLIADGYLNEYIKKRIKHKLNNIEDESNRKD